MATFEDNSRTYDNLLVGGFPSTTQRGVLLSGQDVVRGEALGKITASGKLHTWGTGGSDDGHRTFYAIAAEDVDATGGDTSISYYVTGKFQQTGITISGEVTADTIDDIVAPGRDIGIIIVTDTTVQQ